jgi:mannan endo-1,4-beta-mannosidase
VLSRFLLVATLAVGAWQAPAARSAPSGQPVGAVQTSGEASGQSLATSAHSLANRAATPEAVGLMRYLSGVYRSHVLAGHQHSYRPDIADRELAAIREWTGKTPAIRGFDLMDAINGRGGPHVERALAWGRDEGGIVQLCWHWRLGGRPFFSDHRGHTRFPEGDPAADPVINADLERLAAILKRFAGARVPVLWRPLHEPPGEWFWWHTGGPERYKRLWRHMHAVLVDEHRLNNLIWVYSASDQGGCRAFEWYPGGDVVDIVGVDGYGGTWSEYWDGLQTLTGGRKMIAMTENGAIPPWDEAAPWLWTMTWNNEIFAARTPDDFRRHYGDPRTITYDDLPTARGAESRPPRPWADVR